MVVCFPEIGSQDHIENGKRGTSLTVETSCVSYISIIAIKHNEQGNIQKKKFRGDGVRVPQE